MVSLFFEVGKLGTNRRYEDLGVWLTHTAPPFEATGKNVGLAPNLR
jgi:hypothetical protein